MTKKLTVFFIFTCLFFSQSKFLFSQDSNCVSTCQESMINKGKWAIVFELGTIFGSSSNFFEAFNLTAKKHLSDRSALRLSVGTNINESTGISDDNSYLTTHYNIDNHIYSFQTTLNIQYFLSLNHKIKPFFSVGPYADYSYNGHNNNYEYRKIEEWGIGGFSSFGVEMFILDNISLKGEYIIRGTYGKKLIKELDYEEVYKDYSYSTVYKLDLKTARLGFSVYF